MSRKPLSLPDDFETKFLSNSCFDEIVHGRETHGNCPDDCVCDCPQHTERRNGVVVRLKV